MTASSTALSVSDRLWDRSLWSQGQGHDVACLIAQAIDHEGVLETVAHWVGLPCGVQSFEVARAVGDVAVHRANMGRGEPTPADVLREYLAA